MLIGAYGYRYDHPMAVGKTEDVRDYLAERWSMLLLHAPWAKEFFVSWLVLVQMLDDGFDLMAWLHERHTAETAHAWFRRVVVRAARAIGPG